MWSELEVDWAKATMARMIASGRVKVAPPLSEAQLNGLLQAAKDRNRAPARRRDRRRTEALRRQRYIAQVRERKLREQNSAIGKIRARAATGVQFTWKDFPEMSRASAGRLIRHLGEIGELVKVKSGRPGKSAEASVWRKAPNGARIRNAANNRGELPRPDIERGAHGKDTNDKVTLKRKAGRG